MSFYKASESVYIMYMHKGIVYIYKIRKVAFVLYYMNYALVIFSKVSHIRKVTPCICIRASSKYLSQSYAS